MTEGNDTWIELKNSIKKTFAPESKSNTPARGRRRFPKPSIKRKNNRNGRRARQFRKTQLQVEKNENSTFREIMDGTFDFEAKESEEVPSINKVEEVYVERLEAENDSYIPTKQEANQANTNLHEISTRETRKALKSTKTKTAPGPAKWLTLKVARRFGEKRLGLLFTAWWGYDSIPKDQKECRTILLFKKGIRSDVGNWRPITIGSIFLRLYAKIWDRRLRRQITMSPRQKAFVPLDGAFENANLLTQAIKNSRTNRKDHCIVFLDLAKAFDTVPHQAITDTLYQHNVEGDTVEHMLSMYRDATTTITQDSKSTRPIHIKSGVKQGCPLSPLLFNCIMDELLNEIDQLPVGILVGEARVAIMAFADDLVLLAESEREMEILLEKCKNFFKRKGLKVNGKKCQGLSARALRGRKNHYIKTEAAFTWGDTPIPPMSHAEMAKYLGCSFNIHGDINIPSEQWSTWLENIQKAPLKPDQKARAIKNATVPRLTHILRLSRCGTCQLRKIERQVRKSLKRCLHLPEWTPNAWIHCNTGGGLPNLTEVIVTARVKAWRKMTLSTDFCISETAKMMNPYILKLKKNLKCQLIPAKKMKAAFHKKRLESLETVMNGKALSTMASQRRPWLWDGSLWGGKQINAIKIISGTLPNKINLHRGKTTPSKILCRRCMKVPETDIHILSECPLNKNVISKRHNLLARKIAKELKKSHPTADIWQERTWQIDQERLKPDITMILQEKAYFIELTVPYEKSLDTLKRREDEKEEKYKTMTVENIPELSQRGVQSTEVIGIAVGATGVITNQTHKKLKTLKIGPQRRNLQLMALSLTADVWQIHSK